MSEEQVTLNHKIWMKKEISKFIGYGFRFCYGYKPTSTLSGALTFKMLSTSRSQARDLAARTHMRSGERKIIVWELEKELARLNY